MTSLSREMRDANTVNVVSSTRVEVDNNTYYYVPDDNAIIKAPNSGGEGIVIAEYVTLFDVSITDSLVTIKTQASNADSVNITTVYVRSKPTPTATASP